MKTVSTMLVSSTTMTLCTFPKFRMGETVAWFNKLVPSITAHFNCNWWWFTKLFCRERYRCHECMHCNVNLILSLSG